MWRRLTILALAALAGGCAGVGGAPGDRDVEAGHRFVQRACAGCHAIGPQGASPNPHSPPFRTVSGLLPGPSLESELESIARRGHVEMPPIYMTPDEIRDVAAYIRAVAPRSAT
jgi:mono/diheme cytochrome c family protein